MSRRKRSESDAAIQQRLSDEISAGVTGPTGPGMNESWQEFGQRIGLTGTTGSTGSPDGSTGVPGPPPPMFSSARKAAWRFVFLGIGVCGLFLLILGITSGLAILLIEGIIATVLGLGVFGVVTWRVSRQDDC